MTDIQSITVLISFLCNFKNVDTSETYKIKCMNYYVNCLVDKDGKLVSTTKQIQCQEKNNP